MLVINAKVNFSCRAGVENEAQSRLHTSEQQVLMQLSRHTEHKTKMEVRQQDRLMTFDPEVNVISVCCLECLL